jgi:hypothetical protein
MLAEMLERSSTKPETDNRSEGGREGSRESTGQRKLA